MAPPSRSAASSRAIFRTPRDGGAEDIILDGDVEAEGKAYFRLGDVDHSPDHRKLLWAYDDKGSEFYTLASATSTAAPISTTASPTPAARASGAPTMTASSTPGSTPTIARRRSSIHALGTDRSRRPADLRGSRSRLLHECRRHAARTTGSSSPSTTTRRRNTGSCRPTIPTAEPKLVAPRETGLQYDLEEGGDIFFILTNADGAKDFKIVTAPAADPRRDNWTELVPHEPGRLILSVLSFKDFLVRLERKDGLPRIVVRDRASRRGARHRFRRGGLFARPVRLLRIRHRRSCAFPIRR